MTCRTSQINMHDALYDTAKAYPGGVEAIAQRLNKAVQVMYSKLRRDVSTHHTSYEEAASVMEMAAAARQDNAFQSLHALCWRLGHVAFPITQIEADLDPTAIMKHLCHTFKEGGDVAQAVEKSLADDERISQREFELIDKEIMDAVHALVKLRELCRIKNERDGEV